MVEKVVTNRIDRLFEQKKEDILSIFFTAGHPQLEDTVPILEGLAKSGVDLVEIGIPFSDPLADGPVIQNSSGTALNNGMKLPYLMEQLQDIRSKIDIPLILMGYLNPVTIYGMERFAEDIAKIGIDGVILPDLPIYEFTNRYQSLFCANNLHNIFLISPQTPDERIRMIDAETDGFIYMVSSSSITGAKNEISDTQKAYFNRIKNMNLSNPALIGFGISNHETFRQACDYASGAIIGSAFIRHLDGWEGDLKEGIHHFVQKIRTKI